MNTIWMILLSTLAATGCYGSPKSPETSASGSTSISAASATETDKVVKIYFDETVSHGDLEFRWLKINDSRCPTGVTCVWAGEVSVILEATDTTVAGIKPEEIQLTLSLRPTSKTVSIYGYELELLGVSPHPQDQVTPARSRYEAEIAISRTARKP